MSRYTFTSNQVVDVYDDDNEMLDYEVEADSDVQAIISYLHENDEAVAYATKIEIIGLDHDSLYAVQLLIEFEDCVVEYVRPHKVVDDDTQPQPYQRANSGGVLSHPMMLHVLDPKTHAVIHRVPINRSAVAKSFMMVSSYHDYHAVLLDGDPRKVRDVRSIESYDGRWHKVGNEPYCG